MKSVLSALTTAMLLPLALGGCVVVDSQGHITRDEKRFTVAGAPELKLTTFDGSIEIRATDSKSVLVEIEKRGPSQEAIDELKVETRQDGDRIEVEVKRPPKDAMMLGFGRISPTAKLIVTMPRDGHVNARSGDGSIRIEGIHGRLELRTGDGSVRATDVSGQISVATGDGSVTIDNADGDLDVDTGDGGVSLYLPQEFAAEVDAHTGDGTIRNDLKMDNHAGESNHRTLRGTLGGGGRTLRIRTSDGSIRLKVS